ncbi:hypothetical protein [Microbacterium aurum]
MPRYSELTNRRAVKAAFVEFNKLERDAFLNRHVTGTDHHSTEDGA